MVFFSPEIDLLVLVYYPKVIKDVIWNYSQRFLFRFVLWALKNFCWGQFLFPRVKEVYSQRITLWNSSFMFRHSVCPSVFWSAGAIAFERNKISFSNLVDLKNSTTASNSLFGCQISVQGKGKWGKILGKTIYGILKSALWKIQNTFNFRKHFLGLKLAWREI